MSRSGALPTHAEKPRFVARMFGRIAVRYDCMNTLMTAGLDRRWRSAVARLIEGLPAGARVLDVGTGTGKLAVAIARGLPGVRVTGVDFAQPMLRAGLPVVRARSAGRRISVGAADALALPFAEGVFDAVVSAFVVRNLADPMAGLREQARVLRAGGRLVVLEITPGPPGPLRPLFRLYFRGVVPVVGRVVTGDDAAYTYLPESAVAFLEPERLRELLGELGLTRVTSRRMAFGAVALTTGLKPA